MQFIKSSNYNPKTIVYKHAHLSTIIPGALKKYPIPPYERKELNLNDGDFLLIDWLQQDKPSKLIIISHGLEGHSRRTYINSCADYFFSKGFSVLAWNQRSCGNKINKLPKLYHAGLIEDINSVVQYAINNEYSEIYLLGYSMGGALSLNYVGRTMLPKEVKACIVFSVPLHLKSATKKFKRKSNFIYLQNFISMFKKKLKNKYKQFPDSELFELNKINAIKSFEDFDDYFTVPIFGFKNKDDFYNKVSPIYILENITIPTLIVSAQNDPFLNKENFLDHYKINNPNIYFEKPKYGGHVGFPVLGSRYSWAEIRAKEFIDTL